MHELHADRLVATAELSVMLTTVCLVLRRSCGETLSWLLLSAACKPSFVATSIEAIEYAESY
jgi:hypothetical protein